MKNVIQNKEATISILKVLMNEIRNGILCTSTVKNSLQNVQIVHTKEMDRYGNLFFIFSSDSKHYHNLQTNKEIKLIYTIPDRSELLMIIGTAETSSNISTIERYWSPYNNKDFDKGKTDPTIRVLIIVIEYSKILKSASSSMIDYLKLLGRTIGNTN
ncbi:MULTISPECIES: pyridoxamine 5'-phosphate oxidase family protein [Sphingobacterium]|uniref:pyridoxamine 5'-phosphate oxidase family protein n=1 Tax=Sphingobacterium TaxID=28453 RepID=UPI00258068C0|nr:MULTISPECIES: pyridoxamine 5'-phosphate oxidase family protein [Sphingobacterium]